MRETEILAADNATVLRQGLRVLERIDERLYGETRGAGRAGGIGGHFRHVLDFYRCFLDGVAEGRVDYGRRARDARLERDHALAAETMRSLIAELEGLDPDLAAAPLVVRAERLAGRDSTPLWSRSSAARELQFLQSHTIHHYALIRRELADRGVEPAPEFGVAPSTLDHWSEARLSAD